MDNQPKYPDCRVVVIRNNIKGNLFSELLYLAVEAAKRHNISADEIGKYVNEYTKYSHEEQIIRLTDEWFTLIIR